MSTTAPPSPPSSMKHHWLLLVVAVLAVTAGVAWWAGTDLLATTSSGSTPGGGAAPTVYDAGSVDDLVLVDFEGGGREVREGQRVRAEVVGALPTPTTSGEERRAATMVCGAPAQVASSV